MAHLPVDDMSLTVASYYEAAKKLGLKVKPLQDSNLIKIFNGNKSLTIYYASLSSNNLCYNQVCKDKYLIYEILKKDNLPTPKGAKFYLDQHTIRDILAYAKTILPVVIKPTDSYAGKGVSINLMTEKQIRVAVEKVRNQNHTKLIVEEFVKGNNYRVLMHKNEIVDIIKRNYATVKGTGKHTIRALVFSKNSKRIAAGMKAVKTNNKLQEVLKKQGLSLEYKLEKNKVVKLRDNTYDIMADEETQRVDISVVHPDNIALFKKISNLIDLKLIGIDIIIKSLKQSYKKNGGKINEVNSSPALSFHNYADFAGDNIAAEKILAGYFRD